MCIKNRSDIYWAVLDMHESISSALELTDHLEDYLQDIENPSYSRVLREMNAVDRRLHAARSVNAMLRKEMNKHA